MNATDIEDFLIRLQDAGVEIKHAHEPNIERQEFFMEGSKNPLAVKTIEKQSVDFIFLDNPEVIEVLKMEGWSPGLTLLSLSTDHMKQVFEDYRKDPDYVFRTS